MTAKNDGGPAYPVNSDNHAPIASTGMTLRDYFAAKAMNGMLSAVPLSDNWPEPDDLSVRAYKYADAMLKAREQ